MFFQRHRVTRIGRNSNILAGLRIMRQNARETVKKRSCEKIPEADLSFTRVVDLFATQNENQCCPEQPA